MGEESAEAVLYLWSFCCVASGDVWFAPFLGLADFFVEARNGRFSVLIFPVSGRQKVSFLRLYLSSLFILYRR